MHGLVLLVTAALLALCAQLVPRSWPPFAGQLGFTGPLHGADAVSGPDLPIELISQYQGLADDDVNCGPAGVAAILLYARPDLATTNVATLIATVRQDTGEPEGDTYLPGLARALEAFGVPSAPLYARDAAGGGGDPLAAVQFALAHGRPVIATVGGAALGRGSDYGDHFVVIIGMDAQSGLVDVIDPDTQAPHTAAWEPGGRQQWPATLVRAAMRDAQEQDALAIVAGAQRTGAISPYAVLLPPAAILALLGLLPRLPRRRTRRAIPTHLAHRQTL